MPVLAVMPVLAARVLPFALALAFSGAALAQTVTREDALRIAAENGLTKVEEVELDDGRVWEVEGRDAGGSELELDIDAASGKVIERDR